MPVPGAPDVLGMIVFAPLSSSAMFNAADQRPGAAHAHAQLCNNASPAQQGLHAPADLPLYASITYNVLLAASRF
jgi:hypothetical protein